MVQTRALPAARRGRGRPSLGRGRGRIPAADPRAAEGMHEEVAESVVPDTGNGAAERQGPQRA